MASPARALSWPPPAPDHAAPGQTEPFTPLEPLGAGQPVPAAAPWPAQAGRPAAAAPATALGRTPSGLVKRAPPGPRRCRGRVARRRRQPARLARPVRPGTWPRTRNAPDRTERFVTPCPAATRARRSREPRAGRRRRPRADRWAHPPGPGRPAPHHPAGPDQGLGRRGDSGAPDAGGAARRRRRLPVPERVQRGRPPRPRRLRARRHGLIAHGLIDRPGPLVGRSTLRDDVGRSRRRPGRPRS